MLHVSTCSFTKLDDDDDDDDDTNIMYCVVGSLNEASDWSLLRLGAIPELFWGAVEFVSLL